MKGILVNKTQLIDAVAESAGLSKADTGRTVDALIDIIMQRLTLGEQVNIPGFGSFNVLLRKKRTGRDPRSGKTLEIPEKQVVKFRPGKDLKEAVESKELQTAAARG